MYITVHNSLVDYLAQVINAKNCPTTFYFFLQDPYEKKCVIGAKETHPDILCGGHRNPYQLKNAIKSGGTLFFAHITWAK